MITVVVPARDAARTLGACLRSIRGQHLPRGDYHTIVVDNGSRDATAAIARENGAEVIIEPRRGAAIARNRGWRAARFPLVAFIDADCVADPTWLAEIARGFAAPHIGGVGGRIDGQSSRNAIARYYEARALHDQGRPFVTDQPQLPRLLTGNVAYRRSVLEAVGGFDEALETQEDVDLSWRVGLRGFELIYRDSARVRHAHHESLRAFVRNRYRLGRGRSHLLGKYARLFRRGIYDASDFSLRALRVAAASPPSFAALDLIGSIGWALGRLAGLREYAAFRSRAVMLPNRAVLTKQGPGGRWTFDFREDVATFVRHDAHSIAQDQSSAV